MIETVIHQKKICVNPEFLTNDFNRYLLNVSKEEIEKESCKRELGYILNFKKLKNIKDNYISSVNTDIIFVVECEIEVLKPEINDIFSGNVCMIYSLGLFLNIKDRMKVLIPVKTLARYEYDDVKKIYFNKEKEIKEGDEIKVKITGVKYSKKNFHCFGELYEEE